MMLAGNGEATTGTKFNVGKFGWSNGVVAEDTPAKTQANWGGAEPDTVIKKGTVVRVYVGTIPWTDQATIQSPTNDQYLVELAGGGYWAAYPDTPEAQALMSSPAYAAALPTIRKRMLSAKLAPKDLLPIDKAGTTDNAANAQGMFDPAAYEVDAQGFPVLDAAGKPKRKGSGTGDGDKGDKGGGGIGLLALLGIGALALFGSKE